MLLFLSLIIYYSFLNAFIINDNNFVKQLIISLSHIKLIDSHHHKSG